MGETATEFEALLRGRAKFVRREGRVDRTYTAELLEEAADRLEAYRAIGVALMRPPTLQPKHQEPE